MFTKPRSASLICSSSGSLDRLSREGIVRTRGYLQELKAWNVGWRSYTQPFLDTGNAMVTDIVLSVLSAVAQQERLNDQRAHVGRPETGSESWQGAGAPRGRPRHAGGRETPGQG
jgi:hypothetical protein